MYDSLQEFVDKYRDLPERDDLHPRAKDLSGEVFGELLTLYPTSERYGSSVLWLCKCFQCDSFAKVPAQHIEERVSCGCSKTYDAEERCQELRHDFEEIQDEHPEFPEPLEEVHHNFKDRSGDQKHRLTFLYPVNAERGVKWVSSCSCGNYTCVRAGNVYKEERAVRSCGCYFSEVKAEEAKNLEGGYEKIEMEPGSEWGWWTIIEEAEDYDPGYADTRAFWKCRCRCGTEQVVIGQHLRSGHSTSCGCKRDQNFFGYWDGITGKEHPAFEDGRSYEISKGRISHKQKEFTKKIYERDDYTCQVCLDYGGEELNCHHLFSYTEHPDKRQDKRFAITLCGDCHRHYHGVYGYEGANEQDFLEYFLQILFFIRYYVKLRYNA